VKSSTTKAATKGRRLIRHGENHQDGAHTMGKAMRRIAITSMGFAHRCIGSSAEHSALTLICGECL
jgi:hypothetical protein